jgi:exo-beta-1,3-glucanase (GH17 family)
VNLQVYLGNYPEATDNGAEYQQQKQAIVAAINTYGTNNIAGVTVGNEFMLKSVHPFLSFKFSGVVIDTLSDPAI